MTLSAGAHNVAVYYDIDINNPVNGAFNEYGVANGALPAGFSWQLGDPNDVSANPTDIFAQTAAGNLLNRNDVGTPTPPPNICCDVAFAEEYTTLAGTGQVLTFVTSTTAPTSGFYLSQFDVPGLNNSTPDLTPGAAVYLQGTVSSGTTPTVPEPASIVLLLSVLGGIGVIRARRRA